MGIETTSAAGSRAAGPGAQPPGPPVCEPVVRPRERVAVGEGEHRGAHLVDVATGDVVLSQTDVEVLGTLALVVRRTHVSSYRHGRWFGPSWASVLDARLEVRDGRAHCFWPDGLVLDHPLPAPGSSSLPLRGPRWPLFADGDGALRAVHAPTGHTLHFGLPDDGEQPSGAVLPLLAITDRGGQRIDVERDDAGAPVALRHSSGTAVGISTASGRVTGLRVLAARSGVAVPVVPLVSYRYDARGHLAEVVDATGESAFFEHDRAGRLRGWRDRVGTWCRFVHDAAGRCVRVLGPDGHLDARFDHGERSDDGERVTTRTDARGHTTRFHLNAAGQVVREVDPLGNATEYSRDRHDRLLSVTDALGHTTRHRYDRCGDLVSTTHPDGSVRRWVRDEAGRLARFVDETGAVWRYEVDDRGHLVALVDPLGARTEQTFDDTGAPASRTDPLGATTYWVNDRAGLPVAVIDPLDGTTRCVRDVFGRPVSVTDPVGGVHRFRWSPGGALLETVGPDGARESWTVDAEGHRRRHVDAMGRTTHYDVGHFGLLLGETAPDGAHREHEYDRALRRVSTTDERGLVHSREHDAAGGLVREVDGDERVLTHVRDATGRVVERTDGTGVTTVLTRDPRGRVIRSRCGDEVTEFDRDAAGRLVRARTADVELVITRDAVGRVLTETVDGRTTTSEYDAAGRRVLRRTPTGVESRWEYDAAGRPTVLRTPGRVVEFRHDAAGREVERRCGDSVVTTTWDAAHRPRTRTLAAGDPGQVVQHKAWVYRLDGALLAEEDALSGARTLDLDAAGRVLAVQGEGWSELYHHDGAGEVVLASWPAPQTDAIGGRELHGTLVRRAGNVHQVHDGQGRVVRRQHVTPFGGTETWLYSWGPDDRLVGVVTPDGQRWRYRYDPLGRRVAKLLVDRDGTSVLHQVDFAWDGDRIAEQVHRNSRATVWDWDPRTGCAVTQSEWTTVAGGSRWLRQRNWTVVTDVTGTPTELVDEAGAVAWHSRWTAWGAPLQQRFGDAWTPLRAPGWYCDPETRAHHGLAGVHDPLTGGSLAIGAVHPSPVRALPGWTDPLGAVGGAEGAESGR
jgi:YD repeat-containing protein